MLESKQRYSEAVFRSPVLSKVMCGYHELVFTFGSEGWTEEMLWNMHENWATKYAGGVEIYIPKKVFRFVVATINQSTGY